jgi:uncharacterized glyoxalase superfamily protein PhnB
MRGKDGKLDHAAMKLGDDFIMMGYPGPNKNPRTLGQATQNLYVNVDDVDKHFAQAKKADAKILKEPANTRYGHRRYGAEDPEGHQWYFAHEIKARGSKRTPRSVFVTTCRQGTLQQYPGAVGIGCDNACGC